MRQEKSKRHDSYKLGSFVCPAWFANFSCRFHPLHQRMDRLLYAPKQVPSANVMQGVTEIDAAASPRIGLPKMSSRVESETLKCACHALTEA